MRQPLTDADIRDEISHLRHLRDVIYKELEWAIRLSVTWDRCADRHDILVRMRDTTEGVTFDTIRDAVQMTLVQTLTRIFDDDHAAVSMNKIVSAASRPELAAYLQRQHGTLYLDVSDHLKAARSIRKSADFKEYLQGIKGLRDKIISHRDLAQSHQPDASIGAKYGYERKLLDLTIQMFEHIDLALFSRSNDFDFLKKQYASAADDFWKHVAKS